MATVAALTFAGCASSGAQTALRAYARAERGRTCPMAPNDLFQSIAGQL